jgi:hypothetical protein
MCVGTCVVSVAVPLSHTLLDLCFEDHMEVFQEYLTTLVWIQRSPGERMIINDVHLVGPGRVPPPIIFSIVNQKLNFRACSLGYVEYSQRILAQSIIPSFHTLKCADTAIFYHP